MTKDIRTDEIFRTVVDLPPGELAAFLAVAQHGGFRAAARVLGQSASALSHAVAGLERRLKVQLFHRSTRNVSLTEAGNRFATKLIPAVSEIGSAIEELHDLSSAPSSLLRINSDANAAEQALVPLVTSFLSEHPHMRFDIVTETRLVDIAEKGFDCGVRLAELVPEDMIAIPLGKEQQHIVVATPTYLAKSPQLKHPTDLAAHECLQLRLPGGALYRWEFQRRSETFSVATRGNITADHTRLLLAAARLGHGLAYVTKWMAKDDIAAGTLVQVLEEWTPPYPGLCLYYPRHRHLSAGMRAFISFLRAASSEA